jgi:hypothetical protein
MDSSEFGRDWTVDHRDGHSRLGHGDHLGIDGSVGPAVQRVTGDESGRVLDANQACAGGNSERHRSNEVKT